RLRARCLRATDAGSLRRELIQGVVPTSQFHVTSTRPVQSMLATRASWCAFETTHCEECNRTGRVEGHDAALLKPRVDHVSPRIGSIFGPHHERGIALLGVVVKARLQPLPARRETTHDHWNGERAGRPGSEDALAFCERSYRLSHMLQRFRMH